MTPRNYRPPLKTSLRLKRELCREWLSLPAWWWSSVLLIMFILSAYLIAGYVAEQGDRKAKEAACQRR